MTAAAATVAVVLALMLGVYGGRLLRANDDLRQARARADAAGKLAWRARLLILAVGFFAVAAIDVWLRGKG